MPSPFPGMDPYLEAPTYFGDLHQSLITYFRDQLGERLPEPYYAAMSDRVWLEKARKMEPDVDVLRRGVPTPRRREGSTVVADVAEPVTITLPLLEVRETYVDIFTRQGKDERLVASIEILSPSNKTPGDKGEELYKRKQAEILSSQSHLVEIDLLRGGTHVTCIPLDELRARIPLYDYHVCVKHFDNAEDYFIYPIELLQSLPAIAVPLLPGDASVRLDLQAALDRAYQFGRYKQRIDYSGPVPPPSLSSARAAWVKKLLRPKKPRKPKR